MKVFAKSLTAPAPAMATTGLGLGVAHADGNQMCTLLPKALASLKAAERAAARATDR